MFNGSNATEQILVVLYGVFTVVLQLWASLTLKVYKAKPQAPMIPAEAKKWLKQMELTQEDDAEAHTGDDSKLTLSLVSMGPETFKMMRTWSALSHTVTTLVRLAILVLLFLPASNTGDNEMTRTKVTSANSKAWNSNADPAMAQPVAPAFDATVNGVLCNHFDVDWDIRSKIHDAGHTYVSIKNSDTGRGCENLQRELASSMVAIKYDGTAPDITGTDTKIGHPTGVTSVPHASLWSKWYNYDTAPGTLPFDAVLLTDCELGYSYPGLASCQKTATPGKLVWPRLESFDYNKHGIAITAFSSDRSDTRWLSLGDLRRTVHDNDVIDQNAVGSDNPSLSPSRTRWIRCVENVLNTGVYLSHIEDDVMQMLALQTLLVGPGGYSDTTAAPKSYKPIYWVVDANVKAAVKDVNAQCGTVRWYASAVYFSATTTPTPSITPTAGASASPTPTVGGMPPPARQ